MLTYENMLEAKSFIELRITKKPKIGVILGSGLGNLVNQMKNLIEIPFEDIPHFKKPKAVGHSGVLALGELNGVYVAALKGRYHYYEGHTLSELTFPVRILKLLGVNTLIVTNSCGAVNTSFKPGELMIITDHLNLTGKNPLMGDNFDELGPRFPDASNIYTKALRKLALEKANKLNIKLNQGVYAWWTGPSYETPAEIKMIRTLGADAVGMSTVPEALVASHMGMDVLGISCLTNMASGILDKKLTHDEVIEVAGIANESFSKLIINVIHEMIK
jgi:purine-nucleoside phosphorylase